MALMVVLIESRGGNGSHSAYPASEGIIGVSRADVASRHRRGKPSSLVVCQRRDCPCGGAEGVDVAGLVVADRLLGEANHHRGELVAVSGIGKSGGRAAHGLTHPVSGSVIGVAVIAIGAGGADKVVERVVAETLAVSRSNAVDDRRNVIRRIVGVG